ncbi:MAG TPA: HAMP domain-containing sensor histidine kinase [Rhizomicrobium sp.]|nr:HAMP domain-containing sensor histidine kinase [Rhizomicrobium sp.]
MFKQKLLATLTWSALCIAVAMVIDYVVTILIMRDYPGYTPSVTFIVATSVSLPVTFVLVNSRANLRRARDELAAARDEAVNANRSKTLFFANMSHELRTPLNAIIGFSQLLESDVFATKRPEYARLIRDAGQHLLDLVNDLLDVSKIEAGKTGFDETDVPLGEVIAECCSIVEPRARTARLHLTHSTAADLPFVRGDQRAIKQIVLNLLTNAIKFNADGGSVEAFAAITPSGEIAFGVRDDGIGIADEDRLHVFEPYGRARHEIARAQEGTGLGLPIVKGLVDAHGGRISLESELGRGTCVTIYLPADRARAVTLALAS